MKIRAFAILLLLVCIMALPDALSAQSTREASGGAVEVMSGGKAYQSYLAAPSSGGPYPGIILIHSFMGLEEGYKTMVDQFAAQGYVVLAVGWQTFEQQPSDDTVQQLVKDGIAYLKARSDVDPNRLGLTGFCAGGRYTMLFLPQISDFKAGVAWYGFPFTGTTQPDSLVSQLKAPMLMIHGAADQASPIANIYKYATDLAGAGATFELKVYSDKPHGFMVVNSQLQTDPESQDAFNQMVDFFNRKLNGDTAAATPAS